MDHRENQGDVAAAGAAAGEEILPVEPALRELAAALAKVHAARALAIDVEVEPGLAYPIDRADLLEVAGNLADNACKWARGHVRIAARARLDAQWRRPGLLLEVSDDGPGIPDEALARVRTRGVRLDERVPGHGLGLAMVDEVVRAHGGELGLGRAAAGGLAATVRLPGA